MKVITLPIEKNKETIQLTEVLDLHDLEESIAEIEGELSLDFLSEMGLDQLEED
jgi:hypothetical protein